MHQRPVLNSFKPFFVCENYQSSFAPRHPRPIQALSNLACCPCLKSFGGEKLREGPNMPTKCPVIPIRCNKAWRTKARVKRQGLEETHGAFFFCTLNCTKQTESKKNLKAETHHRRAFENAKRRLGFKLKLQIACISQVPSVLPN